MSEPVRNNPAENNSAPPVSSETSVDREAALKAAWLAFSEEHAEDIERYNAYVEKYGFWNKSVRPW
jgi:hypothetical protein